MVWNARAGERGDDVFVTNNAQFMAIRRAVLLIADIGQRPEAGEAGSTPQFVLWHDRCNMNIAAGRWGMFTSRRQACKCCYKPEAVVAVVTEGPQEKGR